MNIASKEVINSLKNKFQFLVVITLFFPITLNAVFTAFQEDVKANYQIISWGVVAAVLVLNYLLIEYLKYRMVTFVARYIDIFVTLSILCYVPVFIVLAMFDQPVISFYYAVIMGVGIMGSMLIPLIILVVLVACVVYVIFRDEFNSFRKLN